MARSTPNHTAQGRHIKKISTCGQRDIVNVRNPVVGWIKIQPASQMGAVNGCPGVRGVAPHQPRLARWWLGQHVATDITRWQAHIATAGYHDVCKILANALTLAQRIKCRRVDFGACAFIRHGGVNQGHQLMRGHMQRLAAYKYLLRKLNKFVVSGNVG